MKDYMSLWEYTSLAGVKLFCPQTFADERGVFVKTFHEGLFAEQDILFESREEFFSISKKNVIRGMHFQIPPCDHKKVVTCLFGRVLDVLLDIRKNEPTYGKAYCVELSAENRKVLYIPSGIAHGFLSLEDDSMMFYKTSTVQSSECERGIAWDSFGFNWGINSDQVILSKRDEAHPKFVDVVSPFIR